jgi:hypothetical protein
MRKQIDTWTFPKHRFRLQRGNDWSPELHAATTRYEAALDAVSDARRPDVYAAALAEVEAADAVRKTLMLALDKQRRPEFYSQKEAQFSRPVFDTAAFWNELTDNQRRAIGVAAIDREIALYGQHRLGDGKTHNEFCEPAGAAEDYLLDAVADVMEFEAIKPEAFPLPACVNRADRS